MPAKMTERDHFAAAALTGLIVAMRDESMAELCDSAYGWADAMLRERTNHDAAPEARATKNDGPPRERTRPDGTGDTPVTEPMPKEKQAEVSDGWRNHIRPPDAADRALAAACDKSWGIAAKPVAWAVMDGIEAMEFCTDEEEAKCAAGYYGVTHIVPLYRQPQPTLTDAERGAIADAADRYASITPESAETVATLRGLLERFS